MRKLFLLLLLFFVNSLSAQTFSTSNLEFWFSSDSLKHKNSVVEKWYNKIDTNYSAIQLDSSKRPVLKFDSTINSNVLFFDGINDHLVIDSSVNINTIYVVFNYADSIFSTNKGVITSNQTGRVILLGLSGGTSLYGGAGSHIRTGATLTGSSSVNHVNTGNLFPLKTMKLIRLTSGTIPKTYDNLLFGSDRFYNGFYWKGNVAEIIAFNSSISTLTDSLVNNYIQNKYTPRIDLPDTINIEYTLCEYNLNIKKNWFTSYTWSKGQGNNSNITVNQNSKLVATVNDIFNNVSTDSTYIQYNHNPLFQLADTTICYPSTLTWSTQMPHTYDFMWQDGSADSVLNITQPGNYWVQITDSFGCSITSDTVHIEVDTFANIASLGPDRNLCQGNKLELVSGRTQAVDYLWSNGDSSSSIQINNAGSYSVTATNSLGCIAEDTISIGIKGLAPSPLFSFQNVCNGDSINFSDQSVSNSGNIIAWNWSFGDGLVDSAQNPTHLYLDSGKYEVSLTVVTDSGCEASYRDTILIYPNPMANFSIGQSCSNLNSVFSDLSNSAWDSVISWKYVFGNGQLSSNQNPTTIFNFSQQFNPKLTVENSFGCKDSITKNLFVKPSPIADFSVSSPCVNDSVFIQENAIGNGSFSYQWTLWNGFNFVGNQFDNVFTSIGTYPLTLQVTDTNNCYDTISKNIFIRNHPTILNQLKDTIICLFDTLTWKVPYPKNAFSFQWQNGNSDSLFNITSAGTYFYEITDSVGCGAISQNVQVSINPFPSLVTLGNDTSICKGEIVTLKNNPIYLTQTFWNTGDTTSSIAIDSTSNYSVTLTDTMGCIGRDTFNVFIRGEAAISRMAFDTTCILDSTQFYDVSQLALGDTIVSWNWDFGNNLTDTTQNPKTYYPATGFYSINLQTLTNDFCFHETWDTIQVYKLPTPSFSSPLGCEDRVIAFNDLSAAGDGFLTNWSWSFGDVNNTSSTLQNPIFTYDTSGNFSVTLKVINSFGCENLTAQSKKIEFTPRAKFTASNVCFGELAQFQSNSIIGSASAYVWDFGDSIQSQGIQVQHLYDTINTFNVQLIVNSSNGCSDSAFSHLETYPHPTASTFSGSYCIGEPFELLDTSIEKIHPIISRNWKLNNQVIDTGKYLNFTLNDTGSFSFQLAISSSVGCSDSSFGLIKISDFPTADFTYAPSFGAAPVTVDLFNNSNQFYQNTWKLNDSIFSNSQEAEITFLQNGNYTIKLVNTNETNCSDSIQKIIKVLPPILDVAISNLSYEVVEGSFLKSSFEISNLGTRTINYFEVLAETQTGQKVKESFEINLLPGEQILLTLNAQLLLPENNQFGFLCLQLQNPENEGDDDNLLNNQVCLGQESFTLKNIFPNPASNNLNISFIVGEEDLATVEIFNNKGDEVRLVYSGNTLIGINTFNLNVEALESGIYVARITFKGVQQTLSFVITK